MGDEWDAEDFEPPAPSAAPAAIIKSDKWEGEDEDEPVKESWDDEDTDKPRVVKPAATTSTKKKASKRLEEKIAEKEKKAKEAAEARLLKEEANMTPEERMAEKLRRQKLVEQADLDIAKETFGISGSSREGSIDDACPTTKEEFSALKSNLVKKLQSLSSRSNYNEFIEEFIKDVCVGLEIEVLKKVSQTAKSLHEEKLKMAKAASKNPKGKGKTKGVLKMDRETDNYGDDYGGGDYDDFM